MKVGDKFNSFQEFKVALEAFQNETNTQFVVRNCTKLETKYPFMEKLCYQHVIYKCKQGKKYYPSKARHGENMRPNQRSYKVFVT